MTITEWFARAVAAGLMTKDNDIKARLASINPLVKNENNWYMLLNTQNSIIVDLRSDLGWYDIEITEKEVQLRKDGKDLYSLRVEKAD